MLSERERLARDEFIDTQNEMQAWLEEIEAERVDVHYDGVGLLKRIRFWLTENGVRRLLDDPDQEVRNFIANLRKVQAVPGRGAWFWSHFWMEMPEGVLYQESDWMREPVFDPGKEPDLYHYKFELNRYSRDEENIPDWLRQKLEQWEAERAPAFNRRIAELEEDFYVLTHGPRGSQAEREAARTGRLPQMRGGAEFDLARDRVRAWLADSGVERIDVDISGLGSSQRINYWLTVDGKKDPARADEEVAEAVERLRHAQALPRHGAWTRSHLWMDADKRVLHQESDWMGEPDLGDGKPDADRCTEELEMHPREPELTPDWLRNRAEQ
ncbi:hypothetical protein [uncultured Actinomyces sp.]|uniref:hypothetical protein n=1 Tax=uncultured Actinomyces sp. TaxID=249061 RepID=UPI00288BA64B|nr:hypothetical protein [uncultured Actinomyces sp.]